MLCRRYTYCDLNFDVAAQQTNPHLGKFDMWNILSNMYSYNLYLTYLNYALGDHFP